MGWALPLAYSLKIALILQFSTQAAGEGGSGASAAVADGELRSLKWESSSAFARPSPWLAEKPIPTAVLRPLFT